MASITPNKSAEALLAHTQQATATVTVGGAVDVSGIYGARYYVSMGRSVATALTNEVLFRIEGSAAASGDDEWYPLYEWTSVSGKTAATATTLNDASVLATDTTFDVTSGTGLLGGEYIYLRETGTPANSEFVLVTSIATNTITCAALARNHTNGIAVTDLAERFSGSIDLSDSLRIRLVVDTNTNASGQTVDVIGWLTTFDSTTIA